MHCIPKPALFLLTFSFLFSASFSQPNRNIQIKTNQEFEYTSAPGAPDLLEMLGKDNDYDWHVARRHMQTIKLYQSQVTRKISPNISEMVQGNNYYNLARKNSFVHIRRNFKKKTAIEVGAMKDHNCLFAPWDIERGVYELTDVVVAVYNAGGAVNRLDIDNSIGYCGATIDDSSFAVSRLMMLVDDSVNKKLSEMKEQNPDLPVVPFQWAEIEAYPYWPMRDHLRYIYRLNKIRTDSGHLPIETYFLDIDHVKVGDFNLMRDFDILVDFCHTRGVKVGLIINGEDENPKKPWLNKDLEYLRSANTRLDRFKKIGILDKADIIMVQSWVTEANGDRTVPRNIPETGITQTNFFIHVLKCAAGIVDCSIYPELE